MFENKNILVLGLGITGRSAIGCLAKFPCKIYAYDENIKNFASMSEDFRFFRPEDLEIIDFIVKSPGIHPYHPLLCEAREKGIEILSDLELAYRITKSKNMIAITGTNGKTTTTTIVGKILSQEYPTYVVGNIGKGILDVATEATEQDYIVIEASSFQLEDTVTFRPHISLITYVTKDHLDWHETEENYRQAKFKIFANQKEGDFTVLNGEDPWLQITDLPSEIYTFQRKDMGRKGTFLKNGKMMFRSSRGEEEILPLSDIKIPGIHNVMNILSAVCIAKLCQVSNDNIHKIISQFYGVEHRIEFVLESQGVKYYNDSKGTNPDSTIVAVEAMDNPTVLIAGGYHKGADFSSMLEISRDKISTLILFGETAELIAREAKQFHYETVIVKDLKAAVLMAKKVVKHPGNVLLSPACASWDMYHNYEERGNHFKQLVRELIP